jgi:hypothetical protein
VQYLADHPSRDTACAHADRSGCLQTLLHPGRKNILQEARHNFNLQTANNYWVLLQKLMFNNY